ncbi:MAG TPA: acetate/propionate family kinase [Acidobacteriaceae bacterium]|nr:acetate/propionate family kinase [Acidobacteriaceae bacterium]
MPTILTINSGSSSLKLGLYRAGDSDSTSEPQLLYRGATDAIGKSGGSLTITDSSGKTVHHEDASHDSQSTAFTHAAQKLEQLSGARPEAIGYRVVHGGPRLVEHCRITPQVLETLRASIHFAPLHIPAALALIDTASKLYPRTPAFACFDTAFHTTMPPEAFTYAIPARFRDQGVRRYGFHGLSYESVVASLGVSPASAVPPRLVAAHLGNGASLCAMSNGRSVDTSMGLTPTGGIPMGTRTGDLDPGVVLFLARSGKLDLNNLESVLNHESGLAGLSDGISDLRELTAAADKGSTTASQALAIFCRSIAKTVASYAAVLDGLDALVFTGGIGEHSTLVREQVCRQLAFLDIAIDKEANQRHSTTISQPTSPIRVLILPADEDGRIAHHVRHLHNAALAKANP